MKKINIAGIFPGRPVNPEVEQCIKESHVVFCGRRNMEILPKTNAKIINIGNIMDFSQDLENEFKEGKTITVIASGDPIFYGIGNYISKNYSIGDIHIIPEVGSLQVALSRIGMNENNIYTVSLHGRRIKGLAQKIRNREKIAVFTDCNNTPSSIARYMLDFNLNDYSIYVFERLGYKDEKINKYDLKEIVEKEFDPLNIMVLIKNGNNTDTFPDDNLFLRKNDNITKREIRDISIMELELNNGDTLWDVGSGSGSVAVYSSFFNADGKIYAIEKDKILCGYIEENMKKFSTDINIINGEAPAILSELPCPDAVFIGGSSGKLREILDYSYNKMKSGGRLVANITTLENFNLAMEFIKENKLRSHVTQANISRLSSVSRYTRFSPLDQIYIVKVIKNGNA
ncbi:precorrin-6y C5,15-methyltransferase (decarboxylating) subunit CbiE [Ferroplasma sp.]|uniref:precorrin-6y C5,15-methyltransferase (decarboxylating) subunit CbiE n=1 Tax=Ferroplasma sp. TaxID=2591003 RepID=UPI00307CD048